MPALLKITASSGITNASGVALVSGTISFVPTDVQGNPIPVRIPVDGGGAARQAIPSSILRTVTNGSIDGGDLFLANPAETSPVNILYRIVVTDLVLGTATVFNRVEVVDAGSGTWDFGSWNTGLSTSVPTTFVYGPAGTITIRNVFIGTPAIYNAGTASNAILDFTLPQGPQGLTGSQGPAGSNSQVGNISGTFKRQAYTADGSTAAFTLPAAGLPLVFRNGTLQEPGTHYSQSGISIAFTFVPDHNDLITFIVFPAS